MILPEGVTLKSHLTEKFQSGCKDPELFEARIIDEGGTKFFLSKLVCCLVAEEFNLTEPVHLCFESNGHIQTMIWQGDKRIKIGPFYPLSHVEMAASFKRNIEKALEWHCEVCKHRHRNDGAG